ncbi:acyl-CoA dehydrogenase family protein [Actinomadura sp. SCN-SB]|uniref:acyl-CoA dehydrogenase family protein n=1 Tax=Actinomadura sp. SCN-SB TaxID=3373092 RepID=UPI00375021AC
MTGATPLAGRPENGPAFSSVTARLDHLDELFGDPWDDANPVGFAALLQADERAEPSPDAEKVLDTYCLNAEFVPADHGGRFHDMETFADIMRTVWRRDPCLGLGYGFSSFIAGVNVWAAGSIDQQADVAELLLSNRRVASAYHELAHGNDFSRAEFSARRSGREWVLNGRKEVITNLYRADALVLFARTDEALGSRSHSQFLVPRDALTDDRIDFLPRFPSSGMRGVNLGGAVFSDCRLPEKALLGREGSGIETALRSFQLTRLALPAMGLGIVDTGLRTALACGLDRRLYGRRVAEIPPVRSTLAGVFADLLMADAFCRVVARQLRVAPDQTPVTASAVKYLVSRLLIDAMDELRGVIGARAYLRQGPYGIFQKLARDLAPAGFGHASRAACQVTILPHLPRLARRSWFSDGPAPEALFGPSSSVPARVDFTSLLPGGTRTDNLSGTLVTLAAELAGPPGRLARRFREELAGLRRECAEMPPADLTIDASPAAYDLAARYTAVLAAAACLGTWWHARNAGVAFLAEEAWLCAALDRLAARMPGGRVLTHEERAESEQALFEQSLRRHEERRLFDLTARAIPG